MLVSATSAPESSTGPAGPPRRRVPPGRSIERDPASAGRDLPNDHTSWWSCAENIGTRPGEDDMTREHGVQSFATPGHSCTHCGRLWAHRSYLQLDGLHGPSPAKRDGATSGRRCCFSDWLQWSPAAAGRIT